MHKPEKEGAAGYSSGLTKKRYSGDYELLSGSVRLKKKY
jgi:hypothetical protein